MSDVRSELETLAPESAPRESLPARPTSQVDPADDAVPPWTKPAEPPYAGSDYDIPLPRLLDASTTDPDYSWDPRPRSVTGHPRNAQGGRHQHTPDQPFAA
jgi:hypothetical protein